MYNNTLKKKYIIYSSDNNTSTFIFVNKIITKFKENYKFNYTLENNSIDKNSTVLERVNNQIENIDEYFGICPEYYYIKNVNTNLRFLIKTNKMYIFLLTQNLLAQKVNTINDITNNSKIYVTNKDTFSYMYLKIICDMNNIELVETNATSTLTSTSTSNNNSKTFNIEYIEGEKIAMKFNELQKNEYIFFIDGLDTQIISILNSIYDIKYVSFFSEITFMGENETEQNYLLKKINLSNYNTTTTIFKSDLLKNEVNTYYFSNVLFCNKSIYNELAHYITKTVFEMKINEETLIKNKNIKLHNGVLELYKQNSIISFNKPEQIIKEYNTNSYNNFKKVDIINDNLF